MAFPSPTLQDVTVNGAANISTLTASGTVSGTGITNLLSPYLPSATAATTYTAISDLASTSGAALVGFLQSGTGAVARDLQSKGEDRVSVFDYMTAAQISDVKTNAGTIDVTSAVQAAIDANPRVKLENGTYLVGALSIPSTCYEFWGESRGGVIFKPQTLAASTPLISIVSPSYGRFGNFTGSVAGSTNQFIYMTNGIGSDIANVHVTSCGYDVIGTLNCTGGRIYDCHVDDTNRHGFYLNNHSYGKVFGNTIYSASGTEHNIRLNNGSRNDIYENYLVRTSATDTFCIAINSSNGNHVHHNTCVPNSIEGINITNGSGNRIGENKILCDVNHHDYGISINASAAVCSSNDITNNYISNSGKAGVAMAGSSGTPAYYNAFNFATSNIIISPCQNQLAGEPHAALILYGPTTNINNFFKDNTVYDNTTQTNYVFYEANGNLTIAKNNAIRGGSLIAENFLTGSASRAFDDLWASTTPTITSGSGTLTSASGTVNCRRRGDLVEYEIDVTITTNGTGATQITVPLPYITSGCLSGRDTLTGKGLTGYLTPSGNCAIVFYDSTYPGADGSSFHLSGIGKLA